MQGNQIITIIVLFVGAILAVLLGSSIGSEDRWMPMIFIGSAIAFVVVTKLGSDLWILIPIFWFWTGKILLLPLPFSIRNIVTLFVIGFTAIALPLGGVKIRGKLNVIDWCVIILILDIGMTFAMNPMGLRSMSSSTVGARPYMEIGLAALAYLIISNQSLSVKKARNLVLLVVGSAAVLSLGNILAAKTNLGWTIGYINSDWSPAAGEGFGELRVTVERVSMYSAVAGMTLMYLFSLGNPLTTLNPLKWSKFTLLVAAALGILVSGFRSAVVLYSIAFLISTYLYGRMRALTLVATLGGVMLTLVIVANTVYPLPLPIQRSLSFLPGEWDRIAEQDAEQSGEWRFEMWEVALTSDEMIKNKWLGDGFGFSAREMAVLENARMGGESQAHVAFHEHMMISGGFHSGPISSMRYVGILGFFIYLALSIAMAIVFYRSSKQAIKSPFAVPFLFFGLYWIIHPMYFVFIFGQYDTYTPNLIVAAGVLKMLLNSFREYQEQEEEAKEHATKALEV